ncbi:DUF4225 domain-containing protein [Pectobacterium carotovorum]|uniref:DUF4225 domain-containing protein n=1 Tax=Pectobacterium TaxID=122277 RepID=UPI0020BFC500|nr:MULTISPECIES: DUF4225 domain-containing protein [Pectobacterium]MDX6917692.1 DUF4225 domain-containing protein [Pectobacterium carotovorum]
MSIDSSHQFHFLEESNRLRRVALLASSFFIQDKTLRMRYLREIEDFINETEMKLRSSTISFFDKNHILYELVTEREETERDYQKLRTGDYVKYIVTDIFEDQGVLKYTKIASGVVSGGFQAFMGYRLNQLGRYLNIKHFKSFGVLLISHGFNNAYESATPIIFDGKYSAGPVRHIYRGLASLAGYNDDAGDALYSAGDLSLTIYASLRTPVLVDSPTRLASRGFMDKPGTTKLFKYAHGDFKPKYTAASSIMKLYMVGGSAYKIYAEFTDDNYRLGDK